MLGTNQAAHAVTQRHKTAWHELKMRLGREARARSCSILIGMSRSLEFYLKLMEPMNNFKHSGNVGKFEFKAVIWDTSKEGIGRRRTRGWFRGCCSNPGKGSNEVLNTDHQ